MLGFFRITVVKRVKIVCIVSLKSGYLNSKAITKLGIALMYRYLIIKAIIKLGITLMYRCLIIKAITK